MRTSILVILSILILPLQAQQPVIPQKDLNGNFSFQVGDVFLRVNSKHGARIDSYKLKEFEFLYLEKHSGIEDMYGSTAWISPQTLWGWPPQSIIDTEPYSGGISGNTVILTSGTASANNSLKFQIRKTFSADLQDSSVSIKYTIINKSSDSRSFASWEIMRVPTGGLSFFPINGTVSGKLEPAFVVQEGIAWWDYDSTKNIFEKAFADGKDGWLAHVDNKRIIHIKKFVDSPSNFPSNSEKEIEFWANDKMYYNEIEKHSEYKTIPANDSTTLTVTWFLRKLPENISVSKANPDLLDYVSGIVNPIQSSVNSDLSRKPLFAYSNSAAAEIKFTGLEEGIRYNFSLFNVIGEKVLDREILSGETVLTHSLNNGVYIYRIQSPEKIYTGKISLKAF